MSLAPDAAFATACAAPYLTLNIDPRGVVRACGENRLYTLGRLPAQTLAEIWHGPELARLRATLADGDLSMGCEGCARAVRSGRRREARAGLYDGTAVPSAHPARPVRLELELSNRCNLQCVMCNGELSSSIRTHREHREPIPRIYDDWFFEQLEALAPALDHVSFLGGEPFLGPEPLRAFEVLSTGGFTGRCHVTTNGTVVNDRVARIIDALPVDVSVSVDGHTRDTVESIRVGARHDELLINIAWFHAAAQRRGTRLAFHYCLMPRNAPELLPFMRWADDLDADVIVLPVRHPLEMSVDLLPLAELEALVDELRHQDTAGPGLERNLAAWRSQLDRLAEVVGHRGSVPDQPVALGAPSPDARRGVVHELEAWAEGGPVHVLEVDAGGMIVTVDPAALDLLDVDAAAIVGQHNQVLLDLLQQRYGALVGMELTPSPPGTEDRLITFGAAPPTSVRAVLMASEDGRPGRWRFAVRTPDAGHAGHTGHAEHAERS